MRIISRRTLRDHRERSGRGDSEAPITARYKIARRIDWAGPADAKNQFRSAPCAGDRIAFNIAGDKYRLVVGTALSAPA